MAKQMFSSLCDELIGFFVPFYLSDKFYDRILQKMEKISFNTRSFETVKEFVITVLMALEVAGQAALAFWSRSLTTQQHTKFYNPTYLALNSVVYNLFWVVFNSLGAWYNYQLFFIDHRKFVLSFKELLNERMDPTIVHKINQRKYRLFQGWIKRRAIRIANIFQCFRLVIVINGVYLFFVISSKLENLNWAETGLSLLLGMCFSFSTYFSVRNCIIAVSLSSVSCLKHYALFKKIQPVMNPKSDLSKKRYEIFKYRKNLILLLADFSVANEFIGNLFVPFLVGTAPLSAYLLIWVIFFMTFEIFLTPLTMASLYALGCGLFGLHWAMSMPTERIHSSTPLLQHGMAAMQHLVGDFSARFKLAITFMEMSTRNRYGITYACFGLITVGTFYKFLLLYGEIGSMWYKHLRFKSLGP